MYNRKKLLLPTIIFIICIIGISYAYFEGVVHGTGNTNVEGSVHTATIQDLILTGTTEVVNNNMIPGEASTYSFTIENPNNFQVCFGVYFDNVVNSFVNTSDLEVFLNGVVGVFPSTGDTSTIVGGIRAPANSTTTYTIIISYKDVEGKDQTSDIGKTFSGIIKARATECAPLPSDVTLARLQELNPGIIVTPSTPNYPDFSTSDGTGVFDANDNYGLSYYFRGNIDYNYVKFGKWQTDYYSGYDNSSRNEVQFTSLSTCEAAAGVGNCTKYASAGDDMYWRIVRINGDGSIRMIYDGVRACDEDCIENDYNTKGIGISDFHSSNDDNAHVGYMYGTLYERTEDNTTYYYSTSYDGAHENLNDSPIKIAIDTWYERELANTSYHNYISDTLFCNDRSIASADATDYVNNNWGYSFENLGYGDNDTMYGGYGRDIEQNYMNLGNRLTFFCPQKNDRFTINDTTIGNGALTYPAGLITHDEASIGGSFLENSTTYLTMTPGETMDTGVFIFDVVGEGETYFANLVRPVINLKGDALTAGNGTVSNPFIVTNN